MLKSWRQVRAAVDASLAAKLGVIGAALLLLALASVGLTLWVTWQLEGGAAAVNEAGRLRMQTWRLAQTAVVADPARLAAQAAQFDASLGLLASGDPARPLLMPQDASTRAAFDQVRRHWLGARAAWLAPGVQAPGAGGTGGNGGADGSVAAMAARHAVLAESLVADVDAFVSAIEGQLARWTMLLSVFQLGLMALALAGGVTVLYAGYLFVFNPLSRLHGGLQRVQQGDLAARVPAESNDEFGRLAQGFNRMAETLQGFYRDLESKVREKTETLRAERERLRLLYEASAFVGRAATLDELAQGFVERLRHAGRADGVLLRWYDPAQGQHVLLASECVPKAMCDEERNLVAGSCYCGLSDAQSDAAAAGAEASRARVIHIQPASQPGGDCGRVQRSTPTSCERHGFGLVVSVPVRLHEQLLGEADLLYRDAAGEAEARITAADRALLESLAAHLASGMESLRAQALEREAAVANERTALARELHDSIAQSLAFLKIQLQLLRGGMKRGDAAAIARSVDELDAGIRESAADVRELLVHFRTRADDADIVQALQTTLQKFQHQSGLPTQLSVEGHGLPLANDVQLQLLHVVQEALSNVRKHAAASQVWMSVQQQPHWRIEVRDDGAGFAAGSATPDETHVGLRIMRERAATIGASVEVMSEPGRGTRVVVTVTRPGAAAPIAARVVDTTAAAVGARPAEPVLAP